MHSCRIGNFVSDNSAIVPKWFSAICRNGFLPNRPTFKKIYQGGGELFKILFLIVTLVIKVMEYVKKKIMIICYQNLVFNAWGSGMDNAASKKRVLQSINNRIVIDYKRAYSKLVLAMLLVRL